MRILKSLILAVALIIPMMAQALDLDKMTEDERQSFREEIRAYLLDNPEVLIEAMGVLEQRQREEEDKADALLLSEYQEELFNDGVSFVGGNPDGDITIVEFVDYRCGYCRKAHGEVKELVGTDGNIRLIIKEYPILGADSDASARAAVATLQLFGADAYADLYEELITFNGPMNEATVNLLADKVGLDGQKILDHMASDDVTRHIDRMHALGASMKVSGTPTFVVGSQILRGYVPLDAMAQIVGIERTVAN